MYFSVLRAAKQISINRMLQVIPVPALEDNYMYLVFDSEKKHAAAVDPVEPEKIQKIANELSLSICAALVTHHHWDHAGGMKQFRELYPDPSIKIYGGDARIDCLDVHLKHEDHFEFGGLKTRALSTPCHTKGHICYYVERGNERVVLTGDTLFIAGCGKFFEGTAEQMQRNLNEVLASLPDDTRVYPGHEYTSSNLKFAKHIEPNNQDVIAKLKFSLDCDAKKQPTVPSTIGEEKKINPFMRVNSNEIQKQVSAISPVDVMAKLREAKNQFRPANL
ncbi:unnamed protein product, partial [Mesorhabditis belari]|uniref:hydroxyacylglutathione hydrolase n=1 Tax=Mesorhabditis belari TaxID=2138241 RepID=A0AAF3EGR1_9BILA